MIKNNMNDIEKNRLIYALNFVEEGIEKEIDDYVSHIKKVPMLIINNGLLPALAFMHKKNKSYEIILNQIISWCSEMEIMIGSKNKIFSEREGRNKNIFLSISELPQQEYRYWTKEVLDLLIWMKRFGEGMEIEIKGKKRDSNE